jgi:23S rRNA (cytidine1920-2'-O)/16S rRNA (cytidine1409-2'-O)-methyltransferase
MEKRRLDEELPARGLARSRSHARDLVLRGRVSVDGVPAAKPSQMVSSDQSLDVSERMLVGRGALKLDAALDAFRLPVAGRVCVDIGASTGGFTQVLLERGASRVYALDVGHAQLHPALREDPRVVSLEGVDVRAAALPERAALAVADVSFLPAARYLPAVAGLLAPGGALALLVKPQFEVGPDRVGKGGVVSDPSAIAEALGAVARAAAEAGLALEGECPSPVAGKDGNRETFLLLRKRAKLPADQEMPL